MKRETLKELGVPEEALDGVMKEYGISIQSKESDIESLKTERDSLKADITQRDKDIEALRKDSGTSEELKQRLADMESDYQTKTEELESNLRDTKINAALDLALANANVHNPEVVKRALDKEKIQLDDKGAVTGLDEQLNAFKESDPYLFKQETNDAKPPFISPNGNVNGGGIQLTKETFSNMSYGERKELKDKQPEVYKQLTK